MTGPTTNGPIPTASSLSFTWAAVVASAWSDAAIIPTPPPTTFP